MPKAEMGLSQKALADALGLTDRRVRQLEAEFILPTPRGGLYDLAVCRERYRLYRSDAERDWREFYRQTEDVARRSGELVAVLDSDGSTLDDVRAASLAIQDAIAMARFITACRSETEAERDFVMPIWERQENDGLHIVFGRALEILSAERGTTPEAVCAQIAASGRAERGEPLHA